MATLSVVVPLFAAQGQQKLVAGHVEQVHIYPGEFALRARIDTGANQASLNAVNVEKYAQDGQQWVRFALTNHAGRSILIERPVRRIARIRRHGGLIQEREVLLLGICVGTVFKEVEVNLINREGFNYQMVIGRGFLGEDFLVDPARSFLLRPDCADKSHN